jgi:outer membrane protein assembly factor BamE (lipoprotein component of BamABCDE complex)
MKKIISYFFILLFIANCTLNKVIKHHGVHFLEKKSKKLVINETNSNDVQKLLGPPSTKSDFDGNLWIYIERTTSSSKLLKLGKKDLITNNILIVELDSKGILSKKIFLNKDQMNNIKFSKELTEMNYTQKSFIYSFFNSMRQKINDPLGKKRN